MPTLNATPRTGSGKGVARKLRATGKVPAVVYGHGDRTTPLAVDAHELDLLLHSISVDNTVIGLTQEGGQQTKVLIREVQMHPFKPQVLHVDFLLLHAGERLKVRIPVRLSGTPVGVHVGGGVMDQVMYDLEVECLPDEIPEAIDLDVSNMDIGESMRVSDLKLEKVRLIADGDLPIVSVLAPTVSQAEEDEAAAAAPEPEVIRGKPQEGEE
jgi:large subunit ribosomal protein L25